MIVDPDFLDHWRTGMVVTALKDSFAPFYILRIWGHCQEKRKDRFSGMPAEGLAALCKYHGDDPAALEAALCKAKFIERDGDDIVVLEWAERNASLIAAWENGAKGGRPRKEPNQNPAVTGSKPSDNPGGTGSKPIESKSRNSSPSLRSGELRATRLPKPFVLPSEWIVWAMAERPELDPQKVGEKFADFWHSKPGKAGTKLDWEATWRNWVREERAPYQPRGSPAPLSKHTGFATKDYREGVTEDGSFA